MSPSEPRQSVQGLFVFIGTGLKRPKTTQDTMPTKTPVHSVWGLGKLVAALSKWPWLKPLRAAALQDNGRQVSTLRVIITHTTSS